MGLFDALTNAVAGLQAQAYALENISGNIANSSTTGYKSVETSFQDMLDTSSSASTTTSGSVLALSTTTSTVQGTISSTSTSTDLAISGSGYFQVVAAEGTSDGSTVLGSEDYYTRQGDFTLTSDGYLENSSGYYLTGIPVDSTTGNATGSTAEPIQISTATIPAEASTTITYSANLPSDSSVTTLGDATDYTSSTGYPTTVSATDSDTFLADSIAGGSVTLYDASGDEYDVTLRWAKTGDDTWSLYYESDASASGTDSEWTSIGTSFTFNSSGTLTSPTTSSVDVSDLTIEGTDLGTISVDLSGGLTQYNSGTTVSELSVSQNGYAAGTYSSLSISDGIVSATYSNGKTLALYQVGVYTFASSSNLLSVSGNAYRATKTSGSAVLGDSSTIESSSLESSNVDITDQLSKMIVTQQAYAANSKVMQTANQMMQDLIDITS